MSQILLSAGMNIFSDRVSCSFIGLAGHALLGGIGAANFRAPGNDHRLFARRFPPGSASSGRGSRRHACDPLLARIGQGVEPQNLASSVSIVP